MDGTTFLTKLSQSGLLSAEEFHDVEDRFPAETPAPSMAQALITDNRLTPYQAQQLLSEKARRLVLGQYQILEEIGRGGMGQVYKALHTVMGRVVALKVLAGDGIADPHSLALFRREVRTATVLHHPNVVVAHDANECDGVHFLVMEFVDGPNLDAVIKRYGPLPVWLACEMVRQTAEALRYAAGKGMVHRDIKPANLLLADWDPTILNFPGEPTDASRSQVGKLPVLKVLDFGIARLRLSTAETLPVRDAGHMIGTPDFISPEQAHDIHAADIRSDLYSLGCTFYFMLTGRVPFPGESPLEKVLHHALEEPAAPETYCPGLPPEIAVIVARLMEKNPDQRFQFPEELIRALRPWCRPPSAARAKTAGADEVFDSPHVADESELSEGAVEDTGGDDSADDSPAAADDLAEAWQAWVSVVTNFVEGYGNRDRLTQQDYAALHAAALEACRQQARQSPPENRPLIQRLSNRVEPWLSLEVLARTDHAILSDLVASCRQLEPLLRNGRPQPRRWPLGALALTVIGMILGWLVFDWLSLPGQARRTVGDLIAQFTVTLSREFQSHPVLWGAAFCSAAVLLAIYLVARLPRA